MQPHKTEMFPACYLKNVIMISHFTGDAFYFSRVKACDTLEVRAPKLKANKIKKKKMNKYTHQRAVKEEEIIKTSPLGELLMMMKKTDE